jgi:competence protein ComEC
MFKKIIILALAINIALLVIVKFQTDDNLKIYFFNVGQGDAVYIRTPQQQDILIDGGPSSVILSKLGEAMPFYDREIDIVILTHPHADHVTGLIDVLKKYRIKQVYLTGAVHTSYDYIEFLQLLRQRKEIKKIKVDHQFNVQLARDLTLKFFYPDFNVMNTKIVQEQSLVINNLNNTSTVVKLIYKEQSFLFTGDIEADAEEYLISKVKSGLGSTVLKVPHHGSRDSSTLEFLQAVTPKTAVISVGADNDFGHPHREVIDRLKGLGIKILRTDYEGDIVENYW